MKKKIQTLIPIWVVLLTGLFFITSCHKKYDDGEVRDLIKANQEAIQKTQASIDSLKQVISAGATIVKIVSFQDSTGGLAIYVSNQKEPYKLYNGVKGATGASGEAGANATAWTISDDGFWVKDGEKTGYPAKGTDGATGATGATGDKGDKGDPGADATNGTNGKYYIPHEDGYFYLHEDGKTPDEKTTIQWKQPWLTAVLNADGTLTISGMSGSTESVTFSPTTLVSLKLDMTCIDEMQGGFPAAYVARKTNSEITSTYLLTSDRRYYSRTLTYYFYPSNAAITTDNLSLDVQKRNQEAEDYDFQIQSLNVDKTRGTLSITISSSENATMADNLAKAYNNPPLFALKYTDSNSHTVLSDYAAAMPVNGGLAVSIGGMSSHTSAWVQLWSGGPRFQYLLVNNKRYNWGKMAGDTTPASEQTNIYFDEYGNLKPQYDTVTLLSSDGRWRMPTKNELEEFCNRYSTNYTVIENYHVFKGTGKFEMNRLYLWKLQSYESTGYWSSSVYNKANAYCLHFENNTYTVNYWGTTDSHYQLLLPVLK